MKTVAWKKICKPLQQGGLGIRSINDVAEEAIRRQVWPVASKKKSIWADWVYNRYIKKKSFWDIKVWSNSSWGWRGILNRRKPVLANVLQLMAMLMKPSFG